MIRKAPTFQEKQQVREACNRAIPHATISVTTGIVQNARYINENYLVFDVIIPMSVGLGKKFEAFSLDTFEYFYTQEINIGAKLSDLKPFILENLFKQKFFTISYQIVFVRGKDNRLEKRAVAFDVDVPTSIYETGFMQQVTTFFYEPASQSIRFKEALLRHLLQPIDMITGKPASESKKKTKRVKKITKESNEVE